MISPAPERVLVVDDDPALRELLDEYLSANGTGGRRSTA